MGQRPHRGCQGGRSCRAGRWGQRAGRIQWAPSCGREPQPRTPPAPLQGLGAGRTPPGLDLRARMRALETCRRAPPHIQGLGETRTPPGLAGAECRRPPGLEEPRTHPPPCQGLGAHCRWRREGLGGNRIHPPLLIGAHMKALVHGRRAVALVCDRRAWADGRKALVSGSSDEASAVLLGLTLGL